MKKIKLNSIKKISAKILHHLTRFGRKNRYRFRNIKWFFFFLYSYTRRARILKYFYNKKWHKSESFTNYIFFNDFYKNIFKNQMLIKNKIQMWTYFEYELIQPLFIFEKQFLFSKVEFSEYFFNKELNLIFFKNKNFPGLNYWVKERDFDKSILKPKKEEDEEEENLFFPSYQYNILKKVDLFRYIYNYNFFIYCITLLVLYQILIYIWYFNIYFKK